jgi:hypothetical protein
MVLDLYILTATAIAVKIQVATPKPIIDAPIGAMACINCRWSSMSLPNEFTSILVS